MAEFDDEKLCDFLWTNIGKETSLIDLQKHLAKCSDCKKELKEAYDDYVTGHSPGADEKLHMYNFSQINEGLTIDGFLQAWHMIQSCKGEEITAAFEKMRSKEGIFLLLGLLEKYSAALSYAQNYWGRGMEETVKLLIRDYRRLENLIGKKEFAHFVGDMDKITKGLPIAFLKKTK